MAAYWEMMGTYWLDVEWVGKGCFEARPYTVPPPTAALLDSSGWCFGSPGTPVLPQTSLADVISTGLG